MSRTEKLLERMRSNPRDWDIADLKVLARRFGVDWRQPGTSHVTFTASRQIPVTVPAHKPIKPVYIRQFLNLLEAMEQTDDETED